MTPRQSESASSFKPSNGERFWIGLQPFLLSRGYQLRPRYRPGYAPKFEPEITEDIWPLFVSSIFLLRLVVTNATPVPQRHRCHENTR
jgi:hypothetical protein